MQTTHLFGLIHVRLVRCETSLSPPVNYFTDRSKGVLLLWIIYVISVLFCYAFGHICLLMPCGHQLRKEKSISRLQTEGFKK